MYTFESWFECMRGMDIEGFIRMHCMYLGIDVTYTHTTTFILRKRIYFKVQSTDKERMEKFMQAVYDLADEINCK